MAGMSGGNGWSAGTFDWSVKSNGSVANSSTVTVTMRVYRSDGGRSYNYSASNNLYITINGNTTYYTETSIGDVTKTKSLTIPHNADGSHANITISGYGSMPGTSFGAVSYSTSVALPKIPRYANFSTFEVTPTQTSDSCSAVISWTADAACKAWSYSLDGTNYTSVDASGTFTSGSITVNLEPGKTYNITARVTRNDSGLVSTSSVKTVTTKPVPSLTFADANFNIGNNVSATVNDYENNTCFLRAHVMTEGADTYGAAILNATGISASSYTINLSSVATNIYSQCKNKNSTTIKITFGATVNGTEYTNDYLLTANVVNSNPTFSSSGYSVADTASAMQQLLSNTAYMVQGYGAMKATISTHASALNQASISKYSYVVYKTAGSNLISGEVNEASGDIIIDFANASKQLEAGTYTISVTAIDTRGNKSGVVTKTFTVLPYHLPIQTINVNRLNGFEAQIEMTFSSNISRLAIGSSNKNNVSYLAEYRYKDSTTSTWGSWTNLGTFSTPSTSGDNLVYTKNQTNPSFLLTSLDISKSYNFEFRVQDGVCNKNGTYVTTSILLPQGKPIFIECDDGHIAIGDVPDFNNANKLQVDSDILAKDPSGTKRQVFGTMQEFVHTGSRFSGDALDGSLWFDTGNSAVPSDAILPDGGSTDVVTKVDNSWTLYGESKNAEEIDAASLQLKIANGEVKEIMYAVEYPSGSGYSFTDCQIQAASLLVTGERIVDGYYYSSSYHGMYGIILNNSNKLQLLAGWCRVNSNGTIHSLSDSWKLKVYYRGDKDIVMSQALSMYPVGSVYETMSADFNPNVSFGGTWVRIRGKTLVGVDEGDTDFNEANKTGGAKTHTHTYGFEYGEYYGAVAGAQNSLKALGYNADNTTYSNASVAGATATVTRTVNNNITNASKTASMNNLVTYGNTQFVSTMQPYITVYIWYRTA